MITLREEGAGGFASLVDERAKILEQLADHTAQMLSEVGGLLAETGEYVLAAPGKLLRPLLLLEACRAAGGDPDVAFPAAAGTEYGHIASLIHDDIIDGDRERRGQPTLQVKYNLPTALLTGDFLIFETFLSYTQCHDRGARAESVLDAIRTLSATCIEMCRGQALEAAVAGDLRTSEQTYLEMIRLKTASVCKAATRIGACLSGAASDTVEALASYGHNLGMAFQIIDDVLSYDGRSVLVGKPLDSDLLNRRVTLPIIYALQDGSPEVHDRIHALFSAREDGDIGHAHMADVLLSTHALDRARALARRYTTTAQQHLDLLPYSESRQRLYALADIFMSRDH